MKKILLLLLSTIILAKPAFAQIDWGKYSQSFPNGAVENPALIGFYTAILEENDSFWPTNNGVMAGLTLKNDTAFLRDRPKDFSTLTTFDTARAQFFLNGVNKNNAAAYEYRVLENLNKTIVPWSAITKFTDATLIKASGLPQMAYLGGYKTTLGNKIIVDVRKKESGKIIATSVVAWQNIIPELADVYTPDELNIFLKRLNGAWRVSKEKTKWQLQHPTDVFGKPLDFTREFTVEPTDNNLVFYLNANIYNRAQIEYQVIKNDATVTPWKTNDFDNCFVWLKNLSPGDYRLQVRYTAQRQHVSTYTFLILTPWYDSNLFRIGMGILAAAALGFVLFFILNVRQREKAKEELSKKTKLQLELKAIYAQLNPHFIFNALSSIQGLINKQDIRGANSYLSDFARLMRESLNNGNKEQTPLKQELETLETYLKLEQLRFGFTYTIDIDEHINVYETEMPSLLLQPLIENAVKHGVSSMREKGAVSVSFMKDGNNLQVSVTDNGIGFVADKNTSGFGLKLTRDRIKLLNELSKEQAITFAIKENTPSGTKIELIFNNWFL